MNSANKYDVMGENFSTISTQYDFLNQLLSCGIDMYWRRKMLEIVMQRISLDDIVLDLATGTFDIARAIIKKESVTVFAVDFSLGMLCAGRDKIAQYTSIIPLQADARSIPIHTESIDMITIAFGIRNIYPRIDVFKEWFRILKPSRAVVILEFSTPSEISKWVRKSYSTYIHSILPNIASFCGAEKEMYSYLATSITQFPQSSVLIQELEEAGFSSITCTPLTSGIVRLYEAKK